MPLLWLGVINALLLKQRKIEFYEKKMTFLNNGLT